VQTINFRTLCDRFSFKSPELAHSRAIFGHVFRLIFTHICPLIDRDKCDQAGHLVATKSALSLQWAPRLTVSVSAERSGLRDESVEDERPLSPQATRLGYWLPATGYLAAIPRSLLATPYFLLAAFHGLSTPWSSMRPPLKKRCCTMVMPNRRNRATSDAIRAAFRIAGQGEFLLDGSTALESFTMRGPLCAIPGATRDKAYAVRGLSWAPAF
jgi:hypothetical protein